MQRRDLASFFHDLQKHSQCWNPLCGLRKESTGSWLGRQRNLVVLQQLRIQGLINSRRQISRGRPSWRVPNVGDYRGHLAPEFSPDTEMLLGKRYQARIREKSTITYSTERVERERLLLSLKEPPGFSGSGKAFGVIFGLPLTLKC